MRAPRSKSNSGQGVNMTPMIDIVFQLIIFFLLASHFSRREAQLEVRLPVAESGQETDESETTRRLTFHVRDTGDLLLGGDLIAAEQLPEIVDRARRRAGQEPLEVRIRADRDVPYRVVEPILVACARGGVWNVNFAVAGRDPR